MSNAYQCDGCGKLLAGSPSSQIASFNAELDGDEWVLALAAVITGEDGEYEPDLCRDCRMALLDKALSEKGSS